MFFEAKYPKLKNDFLTLIVCFLNFEKVCLKFDLLISFSKFEKFV